MENEGLYQCPDCKKMVSLRAAACPNCGGPNPMGATKKGPLIPEDIPMPKKNKIRGLTLFFLLFAAFFLTTMMIGNKKLNEAMGIPSARSKEITQTEAVVLCRSAYKRMAKYESDIGMYSPFSAVIKDDLWYVRVEGKMQNGFGVWGKTVGLCRVVRLSKSNEHFDPANVLGISIVE